MTVHLLTCCTSDENQAWQCFNLSENRECQVQTLSEVKNTTKLQEHISLSESIFIPHQYKQCVFSPLLEDFTIIVEHCHINTLEIQSNLDAMIYMGTI